MPNELNIWEITSPDSSQIPELLKTKEFKRNGFISPEGTFYGFEGARHEFSATYIGIFVLNKDNSVLFKGTYFNEGWETYLLKNGWAAMKDTSWLSPGSLPEIHARKELTQRQRDCIFDYEEFFGIEIKEK